MGKAILEITDGTSVNTIDLLGRRFGYILCDWRPARPELEYATNRNWFSGTETPAQVIVKPTVDTFTFNARDTDVDTLIGDEQKLSHLLHMASLYWTGNRAVVKPFYIKARSKDETGIRYAAIYSAQLHDDSNPYAQPFFSRNPASTDLIVPITHGEWLDYPPGTGGLSMHENITSVIESQITHESRGIYFLGDDSRIPLVNFLSHEVLTHILVSDDAVAGSMLNLLEKNEYDGYSLFSKAGTKGNYTFFGAESGTSRWLSGGFQSIHFNITTPAVDPTGVGFVWEYYTNAGAWKEISVTDGTDGFKKPGFVIFSINKSDWAVSTSYGISAHWVRVAPKYHIPAGGIPMVSIKHPATVGLPYFDVLLASDEGHPLLNPGGTERDTLSRISRTDKDIFPKVNVEREVNYVGVNVLTLTATNSIGGSKGYFWNIKGEFDYIEAYGPAINMTANNDHRIIGTVKVYDTITGASSAVFINTLWLFKNKTETWKVLLDFSVSKFVVLVGEEITFNPTDSHIDMVSDVIQQSTWTFGDSPSANITTIGPIIPTVKHIYTEPGEYDVSLGILCPSNLFSVVQKLTCIIVKSGEATASFKTLHRRGMAPLNPMFDASESHSTVGAIISYEWNFGDGTTGTGAKPDKIYSKKGIYSVSLKVTDGAGNIDKVLMSGLIYVDSDNLYSGDDGIFMKLGFTPIFVNWKTNYQTRAFNRMYIGARSLISKLDHYFQGFIPVYENRLNPGDEPQPSFVNWEQDSEQSKIVKDGKAYTGYAIERTYKHKTPRGIFASLAFNSPSYDIYHGTYKIFMRVSAPVDIAYGRVYFSVGLGSAEYGNHSSYVTDFLSPSYITAIDLGSVTLGGEFSVEQVMHINWNVDNFYVGGKVRLYDIVLIPQDTWYVEINFPPYKYFQYNDNSQELLVSSITPSGNLESKITAPAYLDTTLSSVRDVKAVPSIIPGMPLSFLGADTRFTVFTCNIPSRSEGHDAPSMFSRFDYYYELSTIEKVNRYFSSRGRN